MNIFFLTVIIQILFISMMILSIIKYLKNKTQTRLDIMLMFSSLGLNVSFNLIIEWGATSTILPLLSSIVLLAHPFLMIRLVQHFRWVPPRRYQLIASWAAFSILLLFIFPAPRPTAVLIIIVSYFVLIEFYAALSFIRDSQTATGVMHYRLLIIATGSILLGVAICSLVATIIWPAQQELAIQITLYLGLFIGLSYYLGFSPPSFLLRIWQLHELEQFIKQLSLKPISQQTDEIPDLLCQMATQAVGGNSATLALWQEEEQSFMLQPHNLNDPLHRQVVTNETFLNATWQNCQGSLVTIDDPELDDELLTLMLDTYTTHCLIVPICSNKHKWGLLFVFLMRDPLFPKSDLHVLELLTRQVATTLDYATLLLTEKQLSQHNRLLYRQVEHYAKNLEGQVAERTKELEEKNSELDAFAHTVAHDLKNPLSLLIGYSNYLTIEADSMEKTKIKELLGVIEQSAKKMNQIIDEILLLSSTNSDEIKLEQIDMHQVVVESKQRLLHMIEERDATIEISEQFPTAIGYAPWLEEIWANYISNAIKYGGSPPEIKIGATADQTMIRFWVEDNGSGIPVEEQGQLFQNFSRLTTAVGKEGHGLGLAIVQRIAKRLGGDVGVETGENGGSRFYFTLPKSTAY